MSSVSQQNGMSADEVAVRALFEQLNEAWGNTDAYAALFTEDADYVAFDGSHAKGREAIANTHRPLFEGFMKGSRLAGRVTAIRFLAPDVALIHGAGAVIQARQKQPSRRASSVSTTIAVRQDGHWLVTAFQNTRYRPFADSLLGKVLMLFTPRESR